ncbi:hypothetical protein MBLNU459_g2575t1 [Dothideomycetes sp. NU459]
MKMLNYGFFVLLLLTLGVWADSNTKSKAVPEYDLYLQVTGEISDEMGLNFVPMSRNSYTAMISGQSEVSKRFTWPSWFAQGWFQNSVALLCGLAVTSEDVWDAVGTSCNDFSDNVTVATGVKCIYKSLRLLAAGALAGPAAYASAVSVWNSYAGQTRRDDPLAALQNITSHLDIKIVSVASSNVTFDNGFHFDFESRNSTGTLVTNETHGWVSNAAALTKRDTGGGDTFSFSDQVAGIKMSFIKPCANNNFYENSPEGGQMDDVWLNFAYWSAYTKSADKYMFELYNPANNNANYLLGTIIAEQSGFGSNYEGFPYDSAANC